MNVERNQELEVIIENGVLKISIGVETLCFAALRGAYFDRPSNETAAITDSDVFAAEILHRLLEESETGNTLVHTMFDSAVERAVEYGAEGIEFTTTPDRAR